MDNIVLTFKSEALHFLGSVLEGHRNLIQMTRMNDVVKDELLKDVGKIKITLKNAKEKEGVEK